MRVIVTVKVKAVTPNPQPLFSFLKAYRDWTQYVVNQIWPDRKTPSMRELHGRFYRILRKQGFRAHHCHKIERRAKEVVKTTKRNKGNKPVLRKLTARLDYQDYKLDLDGKVLRIAVLDSEWVELRLQWYNYLRKYFNGKWRLKEILVSYRDNTIWVYLTFEKKVELKKPRTIMGIDINFNSIAYTIIDLSGRLVTMGTILFNGLRRALSHKIMAENIQRKYSKKWRNTKGIRETIKRHGRRARSILLDSCHYISRRIIKIAEKYNAWIVLEDLNKLRSRSNNSRRFNKRLSLWAYRRIQGYIQYKGLIEGLNTLHVNPWNTSKKSPIGGNLVFINYRWVRLPNDVVTTRDIVASWNIALRGLNLLTRDVGLRGSVEALKAPNQMQSQEGMRGKPVQVLQITKIT
jgi:putative transposase